MSIRRLIQRQIKLQSAGGETVITQPLVVKRTVATIATVGAGTYSAANLLGGLILRDPAGADRVDTISTAALIITKVNNAKVGSSFAFTVRNTADANEVITVVGGTGVTMSGKVTIGRGESRRFILVVTSIVSKTITVYDAGLVSNVYLVQCKVPDISSVASVGFVVAPYAGRLIRAYSIIDGAIITGDAILTLASSVGDVTETITIANAASAAGDIDTISPAVHANTVVGEGTLLKATSDGGSTNVVSAIVVFEIERD